MQPKWKEEYFTLIKTKKFEDAIMLKEKNSPCALFKYKSLTERTLESLESCRFWMATIGSLNDPFEYSFSFNHKNWIRNLALTPEFKEEYESRLGVIIEEADIAKIYESENPDEAINQMLSNKGRSTIPNQEAQIKVIRKHAEVLITEARERFKVCCFSESNDLSLLWSHYADDHKGICIEFDFSALHITSSSLQPITYSDKPIVLNSPDDLNGINGYLIACQKSLEWEYEQEWRIIDFLQNDDIELPNYIKTPSPKAIYVCDRFERNPEILKARLKQVAQNLEIPIWQMHYQKYNYKLVKGSRLS